VLLIPFVLLLQALGPAPQVADPGAVWGTVRDGTAGRALAGVEVAEAGARAALSDSAGRYRLDGLRPGPHQLRFVRDGYDTLAIGVLLPDSSGTRVDVELVAQPIRLATLQVVAAPVAQTTNASSGNAELARVRLDDGWLHDQQAGEGDVYRALADAPGVEARGERSGGLHVRGGANADKLVLLDGIPVFSAVHYANSASAINPDAVAGAELHPGVTSAQFGEHLSGVVELETRDAGPDPFAARGAFGSGEIRQSFTGYLPALRTGISVGGRTTYRNALMSEGYDGDATDGSGYRDFLAVATSDVGGGRLRALSFLSSNNLTFPALGDSLPTSGGWGENAYIPRNDIGWKSWSQGLTWSRTDTRVKLETAAWASGSSADVAWRGAEGPERVRSRLAELGISGRVVWPDASGGTSVGASLIRPNTSYAVTGAGGLTFDAAPTVGSVFAEREWRPASPLVFSAGLRASSNFAGWVGLEPRLSGVVEPDARTRLGIAVGRSHQVLQSAVNDESALGLLLGFDLPVAADAGRIPVARADQLEVFAGRQLGAGLSLALSAYHRRTDGLALGAASTRDFFPGDSLVIGQADASGVTGALSLSAGAFAGRASVSLAHDVRTVGTTRYNAGYGNGTSIAMDAGYRFLGDTRLQLRFRGGAHEPASVVEPGFDYQPLEEGELAGTPVNLPGNINSARLPTYARVDLGVRRDWHIPAVARGGALTTAVSLTTALDRTNILGLVARADGGVRAIRGVSRSVHLEVGWRF